MLDKLLSQITIFGQMFSYGCHTSHFIKLQCKFDEKKTIMLLKVGWSQRRGTYTNVFLSKIEIKLVRNLTI